MARSTYITIPNSTLTAGISDIVQPISTRVRLTFSKAVKEIQKNLKNNYENTPILNSYNTQLFNIINLLVGYKKRLLDIKNTLNVDQEYELDRFKIPEINKKVEFLTQSSINNFDIGKMIELALEDIDTLELKARALMNEINANVNINTYLGIPDAPPKSEETLFINDSIYKVDLVELFKGITANDITLISQSLFKDYAVLNYFLKLSKDNKDRFSKRFYLDLEQCLVAAFISGVSKNLVQEYLLDQTGLSTEIITKYQSSFDTNRNKSRISSEDNIQQTLQSEEFISSKGEMFKLEVLKFDRYQLAPVYIGVAVDKQGAIKHTTDETFSNSPIILLNELKFKINYNIS